MGTIVGSFSLFCLFSYFITLYHMIELCSVERYSLYGRIISSYESVWMGGSSTWLCFHIWPNKLKNDKNRRRSGQTISARDFNHVQPEYETDMFPLSSCSVRLTLLEDRTTEYRQKYEYNPQCLAGTYANPWLDFVNVKCFSVPCCLPLNWFCLLSYKRRNVCSRLVSSRRAVTCEILTQKRVRSELLVLVKWRWKRADKENQPVWKVAGTPDKSGSRRNARHSLLFVKCHPLPPRTASYTAKTF
jgi:hypothetical protein